MNTLKSTLGVVAIAFITLTAVSCKDANKNEAPTPMVNQMHQESMTDDAEMAKPTFTDENTQAMFQHYIHIKTALVNSDAAEAQSGAQKLMEFTEDTALKSTLTQIADSEDLEAQRTAFSDLTEKMTLVVNASLTDGAVYQQFCPMAFNNKGGYWLSTESEIKNPYYGDRMLKCGKVTETLVGK
ncbi:DUF3347 domain-containing protein [Subsaximicrobium wynnwilliamsii]|uniref:DUF3347 domain-containing protein n=1 Tax=Subsaximicrobium wynnwilliamsii TaxID=291179 RepID=A0A5C6ZQJ3_9FLAO|nr:DUF3347 domain-containing protein [Subsaximicrobium wynnwilliamsii]TXD85540.1 DUF3347 domain-containing protein [Subsaximicrobium wynnwilliamsii]TXD90893.1 DUF3347 domain-containing protein [Subsaximicrobium wynnwilliamsii]TXE05400.1 DUF3347 domain-containing protein [Subsaximicrobium wynnwilliamsii]